MLNRENLHSYQLRGVDMIKNNFNYALWLDMGLGKTATTLTAVCELSDSFEISRALVIAPLRVSLNTWSSEIKNWSHTKHLTFTQLAGLDSKTRSKAIYENTDIHIINRENVVWLVDKLGDGWHYDMVIIDESSSFKSAQAQRFKALKKVSHKIDRMIQLTGTPSSNGLLDLWSQIYLLDKGERLGKTLTKYKNTYFTSDYFGYKWTPIQGSEEKIYKKLDDICLTMSANDYLEMPTRMDNVIKVEMPEKLRESYKELETNFLIELESSTVEALSAAALTNKLLQFCNGAVYTGIDKEFKVVHELKLDVLQEIIESSGEPILVAYNFKSDLARLLKRFPHSVVLDKKTETIESWNRGEIPVLLAHPASAGHGLNLQTGGHIIVWFGLNWSLELYQQFNARLHRQGQKKSVIIHHITIENSIDQTVLSALENKCTTQKELLQALKEDIKKR